MTRQQYIQLITALGLGAMLPKNLSALSVPEVLRRSDFGPDFVWGTATAAYQIEGAWDEDGKGESNWDYFTHYKKRKIKTRENGDVACDFYHRYSEDIELMRKMNIPAFRFSLGWSRIFPQGTGAPNAKGVGFYHRVIDKCLEQNVEPWVTCYHWDIPQALESKGGWANRDVVKWFEDYVDFCAREYGDKVKNWMVFNEPMAFTMLGYMLGWHAPGYINFKKFYQAIHYVSMSHGAGGRRLREHVKGGNIGTTFSCSHVDGWKDKARNEEAVKRGDVLLNRLFIEPILGLGYPTKDLPALKHVEKYIQPGDMDNMKFDFDFIGVQNYSRVVVKKLALVPMLHGINISPKKLGHDITDMNWEVYPEGIYKVIKQFAAYPQVKKVIVTENGAAFPDEVVNGEIDDQKRVKFIQDYLQQVLKAKEEGVNLGGYFIWSFMDNFEWAEGYRPRFGIVGVDFKTQQRIVKSSGKWYADFLAQK